MQSERRAFMRMGCPRSGSGLPSWTSWLRARSHAASEPARVASATGSSGVSEWRVPKSSKTPELPAAKAREGDGRPARRSGPTMRTGHPRSGTSCFRYGEFRSFGELGVPSAELGVAKRRSSSSAARAAGMSASGRLMKPSRKVRSLSPCFLPTTSHPGKDPQRHRRTAVCGVV